MGFVRVLHYYIGVAILVLARTASASYGQSAALLMSEPLNVRPMGVANAFSSQADDESSIQSNPAGLSKLQGFSVGGGQLIGLLGLQASHLNLVTSLKPRVALGVAAAYLYDSDQYRDIYGAEQGAFNNSNLLFNLALGVGTESGWRFGGGVKALQESYAGSNSLSLGADLGLQGPVWRTLRFGAVLQNLGAQLSASSTAKPSMPLRVQGGLSLPVFIPEWRLMLEAQAAPGEGQLRSLVGTELILNLGEEDAKSGELPLRAAIRAGFASGVAFGEPGRASLGAGLQLPPTYALDYALVSVGDIGATHRVSLTLRFPGARLPAPSGAALSAPYTLTASPSLDGITLTWNDANESVDGYNLYADYGVLVDKVNSKPIMRRHQKLNGLDHGRLYHFYVKPIGSDGKEGPSSDILEYRTK